MRKTMRLFAVLLSVLVLVACAQEHTLQDVEGKVINLDEAKGKWIILNYWAAWCDMCTEEIPELNAFYAAHQKEAVLIGVNYEHLPREKVRDLVKEFAIHYPVLAQEPTALMGTVRLSILPTTFFIDPQGQLHPPVYGTQTQRSLEQITGLGTHA